MDNTEINNMIKETVDLASKKLVLDPNLEIKIVEASDPKPLTDLHGIGGYCPSSNFVQISFDIKHSSFPEKSIKAARLTLLHELHHASKRFEGISIDKGTLYETILYEGRADLFVYDTTGENTTWIKQTLQTNLVDKHMEEFMSEKDLPTTPELYKKWFLGETDSIPKWTGYIIGYKIAQGKN